MATPAEVLAVEQLHQAAQARVGLAAAYLALAEWEGVNALNAAETSSEWLARALRTILAARKMSRRLAVAYYQLVRALETHRTLGVPEGSTENNVTMGRLRSNFRRLALDAAALPDTGSRDPDPDIAWFEDQLRSVDADNARAVRLADIDLSPLIQELFDVEGTNDSSPVTVDKHEWTRDMTLRQVDAAFRDLLRKQAVDHNTDAVEAIRSSATLTPSEVIGQIEEAHDAAGSIGSGTVDALGMDAGREAIIDAVAKDRLVMAVARGTSADPCAFCAMLASRGFVYRSEKTALVGDDVEKVHINCHCFPIVRFTRESQLPELNRYFQEKWPEVTKGFFGNDARKAWRRWIYAQRKANPDAPHGARNNKTP